MIDERTAMITGWTLGVLAVAGLHVRPEVGRDGMYTDRILLTLPDSPLGRHVWLTVEHAGEAS